MSVANGRPGWVPICRQGLFWHRIVSEIPITTEISPSDGFSSDLSIYDAEPRPDGDVSDPAQVRELVLPISLCDWSISAATHGGFLGSGSSFRAIAPSASLSIGLEYRQIEHVDIVRSVRTRGFVFHILHLLLHPHASCLSKCLF